MKPKPDLYLILEIFRSGLMTQDEAIEKIAEHFPEGYQVELEEVPVKRLLHVKGTSFYLFTEAGL